MPAVISAAVVPCPSRESRSNAFRISFENKQPGNYNIQLIDVAGRMVSDRSVAVFAGLQTSEVRLDQSVSKGIYMVKVLNDTSREIYMKKILVQ